MSLIQFEIEVGFLTKVSKNGRPAASWDEAYRRYQATLASEYLVPILREWSVSLSGKSVFEGGCGDGGCAAEFSRAGCRVTAVDIDERLVDIASRLNEKEGLSISTYVGDVSRADCPGFEEGPFDLILLRDVVEHLEDLVGALAVLRRNLEDSGALFVVFPPYYSAYGAHQQILPRKRLGFLPYNKLPFIHLLPDSVFAALIRGDDAASREVARLRKIRLTIRKFERSAAAAGYTIRRRRFYFIRPTHKLRYGMPVVRAAFFGRIPLMNELVVTACYYLLEKKPGF